MSELIPEPASLPTGFGIRNARADDAPLILSMIKELAEYERMSDEVVATAQMIRDTLFGDKNHAEVLIGELADSTPVGFALFFHNYSTFLGRPGLYLEDLFIKPEYRGCGYGEALLRCLAQIAVERGWGRMEWSVLNWNEAAIGFYKRLGAVTMDQWTVYRLSGRVLKDVARGKPC